MRKLDPLFSLKNASYTVKDKEILSDLSIEIYPGEYIGIIGPNGGGKTTLLRMLLGLIVPTSGEIITRIDSARIGYVPQQNKSDAYLFPATVEEIVQSGIIKKQHGTSCKHTVQDALRITGVEYLRSRRIGMLSGGERQRVMIARALSGSPKALLLDEPTSAIDPGSQQEFYRFLKKLQKKGLTILIVSHDTDAIAHEVKSVWCLNQKIIVHENPKEALQHHKVGRYGHEKIISRS